MARPTIVPNGKEGYWTDEEIIVSKTDLKGKITYANDVFVRLADMSVEELIGQPHNVIRHPDMPRCIFKLLWGTLEQQKEIFAYVVNLGKNGEHYWVLAHVTPSFDVNSNVVGYHSNRRKPSISQVAQIKELYSALKSEENKHTSPKEGIEASEKLLLQMLKDKGVSYEEFVLSI